MKYREAFLVLLSVTALTACDASQLRNAADSARNATERMADQGEAASAAREAKVMAQAASYRQQAAHEFAEENGGRPRYEIRKDGNTWTVYDTENNRPARVGPKLQSGMTHETAVAVFQDLQDQEELDAASMGPPSRTATRH